MNIKQELNNYNNYKLELAKLDVEEQEIYYIRVPSCTQQLSDMPKGTSQSNQVEDTFEKIEMDKQRIYKRKKYIIAKVNRVDKFIKTLKEYQQEVIIKRYAEKKNIDKIALEINRTESRVKQILNEIN